MKDLYLSPNAMRKFVNRHFLIRVVPNQPLGRIRSVLVSFPTLATMLGYKRAYNMAMKAWDSMEPNPRFRALGLTIVFLWR